MVRAWHALPPWPDTVAGLTRLRERFIVASLSNGNIALQVALRRHAALPFDMLFSAETFGRYKPDAQTYLGACALLDREPAAVMLVAAHNDDLLAARSCGLQTAFIARPREWGPATGECRAAGGIAYAADSLESLADLLGA
jgi:2-haloacid dehalogenase